MFPSKLSKTFQQKTEFREEAGRPAAAVYLDPFSFIKYFTGEIQQPASFIETQLIPYSIPYSIPTKTHFTHFTHFTEEATPYH
jgi:hypothetical protein